MPRSIFVLVLLLVASMSWAQAYKWRDASGRIQYSDTPPPPGAKHVQQLSKPASSSAAAGAATRTNPPLADQDAAFRKRLVEKQEAEAKQAKSAEEEQARARNCEQAKGQLAALEAGERMVQFNEKGERVALDDAARERSRQETRSAVDSWCK